jgi:hypothetical protein
VQTFLIAGLIASHLCPHPTSNSGSRASFEFKDEMATTDYIAEAFDLKIRTEATARSSPDSSRREFLTSIGLSLAGAALNGCARASTRPEPIIDIHQHVNYS